MTDESTLSRDEFLVRYRLPRPLSRSYESLCFELGDEPALHRARFCARVALRFLALLRVANAMARDPACPLMAPSPHHVHLALGGDAFPEGLDAPRSPLLFHLAGIHGAPAVGNARSGILEALMNLSFLADHRLVVVETWGFTVCLGPRIEYGIRCRHADDFLERCPPRSVLFLHAASGRFLSLSPLVFYRRSPNQGKGSLFLLREVDGSFGHYVEDGIPGCPHLRVPLEGRCVEGRLELPAATLASLHAPPARFVDDARVGDSHLVYGLIWRGGTSDVFAAERLVDGRAVVLKTFEYEPGVIDENWWRFANETRLSEGIEHAHVVRPRELDLGQKGVAHEQDLVKRGSLSDLLETLGVLPPEMACRIVGQTLDAVSAIHEAGVVHNDVKPENILFDDEDRARLIDFGIARRIVEARHELKPGVPPGSVGYVAPELRAGETPTPLSDLYAAGVVLAETLTGRIPADAHTAEAEPGLPYPLRRFLARCLAMEPADRYQSAREAREALDAAASSLAVTRAITLDVEGTLIPSFQHPRPRARLAEFLRFCLDHFDRVFIYTMLPDRDVRYLFASLTARGLAPAEFLARYEPVRWSREPGVLKDLRRCGVPVERNAIVDDMEPMIPEDQAHRWVPVQDAADLRGPDRGLELVMERLSVLFGL